MSRTASTLALTLPVLLWASTSLGDHGGTDFLFDARCNAGEASQIVAAPGSGILLGFPDTIVANAEGGVHVTQRRVANAVFPERVDTYAFGPEGAVFSANDDQAQLTVPLDAGTVSTKLRFVFDFRTFDQSQLVHTQICEIELVTTAEASRPISGVLDDFISPTVFLQQVPDTGISFLEEIGCLDPPSRLQRHAVLDPQFEAFDLMTTFGTELALGSEFGGADFTLGYAARGNCSPSPPPSGPFERLVDLSNGQGAAAPAGLGLSVEVTDLGSQITPLPIATLQVDARASDARVVCDASVTIPAEAVVHFPLSAWSSGGSCVVRGTGKATNVPLDIESVEALRFGFGFNTSAFAFLRAIRLLEDADADLLPDDFEASFGGAGIQIINPSSPVANTGEVSDGVIVTGDVSVILPAGAIATDANTEIEIDYDPDGDGGDVHSRLAISGVVLPGSSRKAVVLPIAGLPAGGAVCIDDRPDATIEAVAQGACDGSDGRVAVAIPAVGGLTTRLATTPTGVETTYGVARTTVEQIAVTGLVHSALAIVVDADADGVVDGDDRCPADAGPASNRGCPFVAIDVTPGESPNPVRLVGGGRLPIALLAPSDFDVAAVDPSSLTLEPGEVAPIRVTVDDVNGDGRSDLVGHFAVGEIPLTSETMELCLYGSRTDGGTFRGCDGIVPRP